MHFEVVRDIGRKPAEVWPFLTDAAGLAGGGFGILRIEGAIAPGARFKLWTEASPKRAFALKVTNFDPPHAMAWESGMPMGIFRGVRRFLLTETPAGARFHMREDYSGALLGLIGRAIPDLTPSFEIFANALKRHAEGA